MNVRNIKPGAYGGFAVSVVFAAMMAMIGMLLRPARWSHIPRRSPLRFKGLPEM